MRLLIAILLLVTILEPRQMPVDVVVVSPEGEVITPEIVSQAREDVAKAVGWWGRLSPEPVTAFVRHTISITSTSSYYLNPIGEGGEWITQDAITVFMVNNLTTHRRMYEEHEGLAMYDSSAAWVVMSRSNQQATIAHELGHVLFDLPDSYLDDLACVQVDIMCDPSVAYYNNNLGCRSREVLGHPCFRVYMPVTQVQIEPRDTLSGYSPLLPPPLAELVQ